MQWRRLGGQAIDDLARALGRAVVDEDDLEARPVFLSSFERVAFSMVAISSRAGTTTETFGHDGGTPRRIRKIGSAREPRAVAPPLTRAGLSFARCARHTACRAAVRTEVGRWNTSNRTEAGSPSTSRLSRGHLRISARAHERHARGLHFRPRARREGAKGADQSVVTCASFPTPRSPRW